MCVCVHRQARTHKTYERFGGVGTSRVRSKVLETLLLFIVVVDDRLMIVVDRLSDCSLDYVQVFESINNLFTFLAC